MITVDRIKQQIAKAAKRPKDAVANFYWSTIGSLHCLPFKYGYEQQYDKIHEDVTEEDKYLIFIVDACRHDYFEEEFRDFFEGELEYLYNSGRDTFEYVSNTWDGSYEDMLYVSGATPVNNAVTKETAQESRFYQGYVPSEHLRILDIWNDGWDDELGTCPPDEVADATIDRLDREDKMISHFFQPHTPYVGDYELLGGQGEKYGKRRGQPADKEIWSKFRKGEIREHEIRKAYRSNLREAFKEIRRVIDQVNLDERRVVITADHGELFGEGRLYAHPRRQHPMLRIVPWLEVEDTYYKERDKVESTGVGHELE